MPEMVALYVDGFNLYHAIDELRKDHLKWLDLWALGELIIPRHTQRLSRVVYCTAVKTTDTAKMLRHRQYIKALEAKGVKCLKGHFSTEQTECFGCGLTGSAQVEKQGDVNLAISVVRDAFTGVFDHAYLLTSDGDQVTTVKMLKDQFPCNRLIL